MSLDRALILGRRHLEPVPGVYVEHREPGEAHPGLDLGTRSIRRSRAGRVRRR